MSVDLDATLESMGTTEFCLVREGRKYYAKHINKLQ